MQEKHPKIYKHKINSIKSKIQNEYYFHAKDKKENIEESTKNTIISKNDIIKKLTNIFNSPNYVYQADVNIMYKNKENKIKKIIGYKDNYILTIDGEKILIDDIYDIK